MFSSEDWQKVCNYLVITLFYKPSDYFTSQSNLEGEKVFNTYIIFTSYEFIVFSLFFVAAENNK